MEANFKPKTIFTGDNLEVMRGMNSECVDLIYLDPPFNSKRDYAAPIGSEAAGAEFKDTWTLDDIDVEWIELIKAKHPKLYRVLWAAMTDSDKSYLMYMAVRLLEMHRVLKDTGSIYLHCDPTMSHYLKLVMDAIFGRKNFLNEVVWHYTKWTGKPRFFPRNHDILLLYAKNKGDHYFQVPMREASSKDAAASLKIGYRWKRSSSGPSHLYVYDPEKRRAKEAMEQAEKEGITIVHSSGKQLKAIPDVWELPSIAPNSKERTGYPTQKPLKLLERVIEASSNPGDVVLDPFCGCATACVAAENLGRNWVGIDISPKAVELVKNRLAETQGLWEDITHLTGPQQRTDLGELPKPVTHKKALYGEQEGICNGCGHHFMANNLEVDHIVARSKGGTDHVSNLQLLCGSCNRVKGDRGMEYLRTKVKFFQ